MIKSTYQKVFSAKSRLQFHFVYNKLRGPLYFGNNYYCNCCDHNFRTFIPKGRIPRENAECPYCGSLERTRLLLLYLKNNTEIFTKPLKVLHIAPEKCLFDIFINLDIEYVDGDIDPLMATHVVDVTNIKYADNYFDIIICSHVLGHVPDEKKAISELRRVLNPNGIALIMTLIDKNNKATFEDEEIISASDRAANYGEPDLCRLHGLDFKDRLAESGFKVEVIDYRKFIDSEMAHKLSVGDGNRELIFCCNK